MDLSDQIIEALRARNAAGETYEQMSSSCGLSGAHIHRLANHRAAPLKMSLATFLALFPRALIQLDPAAGPADSSGDFVPRSDYLDLREKYADLRDQYQDLREKYLDIRDSRPPAQVSILSASK